MLKTYNHFVYHGTTSMFVYKQTKRHVGPLERHDML